MRKMVEVKREASTAFNSDWQEFFPNDHLEEDDIGVNSKEHAATTHFDDGTSGHWPGVQAKLTSFSQTFLRQDDRLEMEHEDAGSSKYLTILQPPVPDHQQEYTTSIKDRNCRIGSNYYDHFHSQQLLEPHGTQETKPMSQSEYMKDLMQRRTKIVAGSPREPPLSQMGRQVHREPESLPNLATKSNLTPPHSFFSAPPTCPRSPQTRFAQIPPQWLPRQPLPPSSLPQHLLPPSLRSTTPPASPPHPSLLHFPPPTTDINSTNLSSSPQSVASSSVPTSGATNVFGGGSTTPSVHHSSKSPLPSSPNIFGCLMQPPPLSLQSRWPPKAKSSQNLFFGQELGILRRKNDNLEKEAKKLRKEKNDLKEDATKWREGKNELESLTQHFYAAKKKLNAEEVSKKEELTRIKIELQLALLKVRNGAIQITN